MAKVSVIVPSFNHDEYIAQAVDSVLSQSERDLELIVVDDGSQDDSLDVLASFSDPRLSILSQRNQGAHAAINRGLRKASGSYVAILNSDDIYHPRRLERLIDEIDRSPQRGIVGSHVEVIDSSGRSLGVKRGYENLEPWSLERQDLSFRAGSDPKAAILTENYWATTSNFFFKREVLDEVAEFRPLRYAHDWDFLLRLLPDFNLYLRPEPLLKYRVHAANTIRENQAAMIFEICWCLAVHLPRLTPVLFTPRDEGLVQKLLHSIFCYDFDKVLAAMLIEGISNNDAMALELLEPENPRRAYYLSYIEGRLENPRAAEAGARRRPWKAAMRRLLKLVPAKPRP